MVEVLEKIILRIYDEEILGKYEELKDEFENRTDSRQYSDNYCLHFIINLAHQSLQEKQMEKENMRSAIQRIDGEIDDATGYSTKRQLRNMTEEDN